MRGYDSEWLEWIKENTKNSSIMKGFNNSNTILESEK